MIKGLNNGWFAWAALAMLATLVTTSSGLAQSDCGCNQGTVSQGYSLHGYGASPCEDGCGSSTFLGRLRKAVTCDPKFRQGLWDGYCEERRACDHSSCGFQGFGFGILGGHGCGNVGLANDCGTGAGGCGAGCQLFGSHHAHGCNLRHRIGRSHGLRMFNFPQAAGCGSGAYGLPTECGCGSEPSPVATADCGGGCDSGGCNSGGCSIFGLQHNCFRNDGHFFGCLSRHGHRHGSFAGRNGCGCGLFSGHRSNARGFGSFDCGHCQNGCGMESYEVSCGTDHVQPTPAVPAVPAEVAPVEVAPAAPTGT